MSRALTPDWRGLELAAGRRYAPRMREATALRRSVDPTIYPEKEKMGESLLQRWILELLRPLLQDWLLSRGKRALVGADQFIYWRQYDPRARVSPDIYVLPGVAADTPVRTWKVWKEQIVPSFAFEVVSEDWEKDYVEAVERYDELGVPEVVIFDPGYDGHPDGFRWQVLRRVGRRGLVRVEATNADRVRSKSLGCWLRVVGEGRQMRVRIAEGPRGDLLIPTREETERAEKERERAEKDAALARIKVLEARLRRASRAKPRSK